MGRKANGMQIKQRAQFLAVLGGAPDGKDSDRIKHLNKTISREGGNVASLRYYIDSDRGALKKQ